MILTEIASGEVRSAATDLNLLIEGPTERIRIPVAFVEDELNLGLPEGYALSYGPTLQLTQIEPEAFDARRPDPVVRGMRLANAGGVYIFSRASAFLAVELDELPSMDAARRGGVNGRYRLFSASEGPDTLTPLAVPADNLLVAAIDEALEALSVVTPHRETEAVGNNAPPPEDALSEEDYAAVLMTLRDLRAKASQHELSGAEVGEAAALLDDAVRKVARWACKRMALVEEGFYQGVGTIAATGLAGVGLWVLAGGKLGTVSGMLATFAGQLLGR